MFERTSFQAVDVPYNWCVDYTDLTDLSEFDQDTQKKNDFYAIKKDKVMRFGLMGQGAKYFYENVDGSFNLNGRRIEIAYEVNKELYFLGYGQKDPITYKSAYVAYNNKPGVQHTMTDAVCFGYKTKQTRGKIDFFYQAIVNVMYYKDNMIQIKLSANQDLDGDLVFFLRGEEIERYKAPLKAEMAGNIDWTIKG